MVLRMSQPSKDSRTGIYEYRKRVPKDLRPFVGKTEVIRSLSTKDVGEAKVRFAKVAAEIEERFANLRAGLTSLTEFEASTMAGDIYRNKVAANFQNPSKLSDSMFVQGLDALEFKNHPDNSKTKAIIMPGQEALAKLVTAKRNDKEINAYLLERGIRLYEESMDLLRTKVAKAAHRARMHLRDLSNDDVNPTNDPYSDLYPKKGEMTKNNTTPSATIAQSRAPLLSSAIAEWANDKKTSWTDKTREANLVAAQRFLEMVGDRPLDQCTKKEAREFKNALKALPKNYTTHPDLKGCTFAEAAKMAAEFVTAADKEEKLAREKKRKPEFVFPTMSDKNVNKNLGFVRAMWNWSENNFDDVPPNPFNGLNFRLNTSGRDDRNPFTEHELQAIFNAPLYTGCKSSDSWLTKGNHTPSDEGIYWVPLIGLFTGARASEIIQLNVADVATLGGIPYFKITDEGEEQGTKNDGSVREIPIHATLLELGIEQFVAAQRSAGHIRLFPEMPKSRDGHYSSAYSNRFGRFLSSLNIKHAKNSFHSFRHNFEDTALDCLIPEGIVDALQGHSSGGMSKRYGKGLRKLRMLNDEIRKFRYENLDLSHLGKN